MEGQDLRIVVIDFQIVAGAVRKPPMIVGTGQHTVKELIAKYNRRRLAATGGESRVRVAGSLSLALKAHNGVPYCR